MSKGKGCPYGKSPNSTACTTTQASCKATDGVKAGKCKDCNLIGNDRKDGGSRAAGLKKWGQNGRDKHGKNKSHR